MDLVKPFGYLCLALIRFVVISMELAQQHSSVNVPTAVATGAPTINYNRLCLIQISSPRQYCTTTSTSYLFATFTTAHSWKETTTRRGNMNVYSNELIFAYNLH